MAKNKTTKKPAKKKPAAAKKPAPRTKAAKKPAPPPAKNPTHRDFDFVGGRPTPKDKAAIDGLIDLLARTENWLGDDKRVAVYGVRTRAVLADGSPFHSWSVYEISYQFGKPGQAGSGGSALQSCVPQHLGIFKACELYLEEFHTKPYRPQGWESEIDEKADAEWRLVELLKPTGPPVSLPLRIAAEIQNDRITSMTVLDQRGREIEYELPVVGVGLMPGVLDSIQAAEPPLTAEEGRQEATAAALEALGLGPAAADIKAKELIVEFDRERDKKALEDRKFFVEDFMPKVREALDARGECTVAKKTIRRTQFGYTVDGDPADGTFDTSNAAARYALEAPAIRGEAREDDDSGDARQSFDATPWFAQATDDQIKALGTQEFGKCREADEVLAFAARTDADCKDFLDLMQRKHDADPSKGGYEVFIDLDDAVAWLKEHRPAVSDWFDLDNK